jgi:hypothetical protein
VTRIFIVLVALFACAPAQAQIVSLTPNNPKQWDFAIDTGWLGGNKDGLAEEWNDWYDTFASSVEVGRYWTPNLKTEASVGVTNTGSVYTQEQVVVPGQPSPIFFSREHHFGLTTLRLGATYQFLENSWVHPFVSGGVQLGWERHRVETPFPFFFGRDPQTRIPIPDLDEAPRTTFRANPFIGAGAKFYVGERGFIRSDLSAAFDGHGATHVSWRAGAGIDF